MRAKSRSFGEVLPIRPFEVDDLVDSYCLLSLDVDRAQELEGALADRFSSNAVLAREVLIGD